jgi:NitT/TauT family transport system ATP-binding protein
VRTLLDLVGLSEFSQSFPKELSGGMRQRAAIARALAYDPQILLMDEPFGELDAITRDRLHDDLLRIWESTRKTIILVTHSVEEATYLADRVAVMSSRPGRIKAVHEVPLSRDRNPTTRQLPRFAEFAGLLRQELE